MPYPLNDTLSTDDAINAEQFLEQHRLEIQSKPKRMFSDNSKTNVFWYGPGTFEIYNSDHETFLWQWSSDASITFVDETKTLPLKSCVIVPKNVRVTLSNSSTDSVTLSVAMPMPQ